MSLEEVIEKLGYEVKVIDGVLCVVKKEEKEDKE